MNAQAGSADLARQVWRKSGLKAQWKNWRLDRVIDEWQALRERIAAPPESRRGPATLLFIPPDPLLLVSSRGDEAMICVLLREMRTHFPEARCYMLTHGSRASEVARELNARPIEVQHLDKLATTLERCLAQGITHCVTIGADVLDGSYDPVFSAELLALTDMLARNGVRCAVNGFSFSDKPHEGLARLYDGMSRDVVFNLRDPVSFQRFQRFTGARSRLSADAAFMLEPAALLDGIADYEPWIADRKASGRTVLGINLHPLLLELEERERVPEMCAAFVRVLGQLAAIRPLAFVLLEHDFRGSSSDYHCIDRLEDALRPLLPGLVWRFPRQLRAAEIKRAVGQLDGVVTGRMHLSIATLGAGAPVFLFDYKAKMEGLLQHFELDRDMRVPARELFDEPATLAALDRFVQKLPLLRAQVRARLPVIKQLAHSNLDAVLES
ncbi:polysaccharide pyruvyl transferase family protein [Derxia gummosa]|uniref:Polysaccharide pyruvyl transferase family protein n=1 Tax=Derxia gummosa DSM 723 TaxID=1121388 RepID=A0A8B6X301_9BURK|nr:polysaccharide pyruvyl transferase family protein [Derxia gummosa]